MRRGKGRGIGKRRVGRNEEEESEEKERRE
jgi:hypothetical protein